MHAQTRTCGRVASSQDCIATTAVCLGGPGTGLGGDVAPTDAYCFGFAAEDLDVAPHSAGATVRDGHDDVPTPAVGRRAG